MEHLSWALSLPVSHQTPENGLSLQTRGLTAQEPQVQPALLGTASPLLYSHRPSPYSCLRNLGCGLRLLHGPELSEASACQLIAFLGLTFICPGPWKCRGLCIWDMTALFSISSPLPGSGRLWRCCSAPGRQGPCPGHLDALLSVGCGWQSRQYQQTPSGDLNVC